MKTPKTTLRTDQTGFASIVIAIVLVMVLSLITVGFAQLMRQEQRQALDKQLSSQAYYAAESGVNIARKLVSSGFDGAKTQCGPENTDPSDPSRPLPVELRSTNTVGTNTDASYPCLLIIPNPKTLEYNPALMGPTVFQMIGKDNAGQPVAIDKITFSWQSRDAVNMRFAPNCNVFPPAAGYVGPFWSNGSNEPYTGLVRAMVMPMGDLSRPGLISNAYTAFLCPNSGGGNGDSLDYLTNRGLQSGGIIKGNCNTNTKPRPCSASVTGLGVINQSTFFISLRSIYGETTVTVRAYDVDGTQLNLGGAQTLVDSTGKAHDVARRIQVRLPIHNTYNMPDSTAAADAICKQLQVEPNVGTSPNPNCPLN